MNITLRSLVTVTFLVSLPFSSAYALNNLTPATEFEIDGDAFGASGAEFDFSDGMALPGYGPGTTAGGTPYSGTEGNTLFVIDGGDTDLCDASLANLSVTNIVDTNAIASDSVNFNDAVWPAPQGQPFSTADKTEVCGVLVATEIIQNGSEFENILYIAAVFDEGLTGNRGYAFPLFANPFDGLAHTVGECLLDVVVGTNSAGVTYRCWDGSVWVDQGGAASAIDCNVNNSNGFFECALNLDQLGVITQDECAAFSVGNLISRSSGAQASQIKDVVETPGVLVDNCGPVEISKNATYTQGVPPVQPEYDFTYVLDNDDSSPVHDSTLIVLANDEDGAATSIQDTITFTPPGTSAAQTWDNVIFSPDFFLEETAINPAGNWDTAQVTVTCTYEDIFTNLPVTVDVVSAGAATGNFFFINNSAETTTTCTIFNVDDLTLPVTLSHFDSERRGNKIEFDWGTSSELFNVGFQLWGLDGSDGQWDKLHNWLVESGSGNAVEAQSYSKRTKIPSSIEQLVAVGISSVDSDGSEHYYGPFEVGQSYGELVELEAINWQAIQTQVDSSTAALSVQRQQESTDPSTASDQQSVVEFNLSKDGLYRMTAAQLRAMGVDWHDVKLDDIALIDHRGNAVSRDILSTETAGKGKKKRFILGDNGEIVFYGQSPSGAAALYTDSSVYRLVLDSSQALVAQAQGKQGINNGFSASYRERSIVEDDRIYVFNSALDDPWLAGWSLSYSDQVRAYGTLIPVEGDALWSEGSEVVMQLGRSSGLVFNGDASGDQSIEHIAQGVVLSPSGDANVVLALSTETSMGTGAWEVRYPIAPDTPLTLSESNEVTAGAYFSAGVGYAFSEVHVDSVGLEYSRPYIAKAGDDYLQFSGPNAGESGYQVKIPESSGSVSAYAWDGQQLINIEVESITAIAGEDKIDVNLARVSSAGNNMYWVANSLGYLAVEDLVETSIITQNSLLAQAQGSNYLMIAYPTFIEQPLLDYADSKRNQGYAVSIINYLDIVDAYGGGQPGPVGLTRYLDEVESLGGTLDHVLIVGGSTYDHTGILQTGAITFIPGHYGVSKYSNYTVSDVPYITNEEGELFSTMGRWPVRDSVELETIVSKSTQWIDTNHSAGSALLIAEHTIPNEGIDFGAGLDGVVESGLAADWTSTRVYVDEILSDPLYDPPMTINEAINQAISVAKVQVIDELNAVPDLVMYYGHASTTRLSSKGLLKSTDINAVTAAGAEVWLPLSCYLTFYESATSNTLAHQLLFSGNAVAITGAMLLSGFDENVLMGESILTDTMNDAQTIGEAVNQTKTERNKPTLTINWATLGDPTTRF